MKHFIFFLLSLNLVLQGSVSGKNPLKEASVYNGAEIHSGKIVIRIKPEFKDVCRESRVAHSGLGAALQSVSAYKFGRKFPHSPSPAEAVNKYGQKLVDLSLIYQVDFPLHVRISDAIRKIYASGAVVYAEPLYIHHTNFTPDDPNIGSQYFLSRISAYTAWDVWTGDTNIVIGIVDSGTDWDHPDLQTQIKYNYADPIDNVDNDNDGFTDNFRGWDVSENNNDPMVASSTHGSHVSGCAAAATNNTTGVAAPAYKCKFLPVKSALDASTSSIDNGYDGIVYAADHGAHIINCSWGRGGLRSIFEEDIVNYATFNKNALVIAAAGNNGIDESHYPASYENVISVASTGSSDTKSGFSNYHSSVDVCAPGSNIYSTNWNNTYRNESGTSMASPVAAGCAAMIKSRFPNFNALQVGAQLRSTADNIYGIGVNNTYAGKLGKGRVNLYKAVTDTLSPGVIVKNTKTTDGNNEVFLPGDTLSLISLLENLLRPTSNLVCSLTTANSNVQILQSSFNAGIIATLDTLSNHSAPFRVYILPSAPLNMEVVFNLSLTDGAWNDNYLFSVTVNVDYINVAINKVATSITSKSLIGYNEEGQLEGLGFTYNNSASILYDMGLMVGAAGTQVSDNMRSTTGNDADFNPFVNVTSQEPGAISDFDVTGYFRDNGSTSASPLNLLIRQNAYAWIAAPDDKYVMVQYIIKNNGSAALNGLYAGLFADWDIPLYSNNKCATDASRRMGYIWSTDAGGLYGGMKVLSQGGFNHYALDNTANNGGINMTDGYSNAEKFSSLSTLRTDAGTATSTGNDVLSVVSTGSFSLQPGDSVEVAFALIAGENLSDIQASADAAQSRYDSEFVGIDIIGDAGRNELFPCYPNPATNEVRFEFSLNEAGETDLSVYNLLGKKVLNVVSEKLLPGKYSALADISSLPTGNYLYKIVQGNFSKSLPFTVIK